MSEAIVIIGKGQLADLVYNELSGPYKLIRRRHLHSSIPKSTKLCVVLNEDYRSSDHLTIEKALQPAGIPWLRAFVLFDEGVVGPLVRPGIPGCSQCAEMRRITAGSEREKSVALQMSLLTHGVIKRDRDTSKWGLSHMSSLIVAEVRRAVQDKAFYTDGRVYLVDLKTMSSSLHAFLPDPLCQICGRLPEDLEDAARITLQPSPKIDSLTYRCRRMDELASVLRKDYWDDRSGLMNAFMKDETSPFCDVVVNLPSVAGNERTAGRSHSYKQSELTAIMEGLERSCGIVPRGKKSSIYDSYQNLSDKALNPVTVGLYSQEQYSLPDFPFEPFDANAPLRWVWGYSFLQERPIVVPEQLAYYSTGFGSSFVSEGSNGCALGGSLEEAIFYGIMEIVERDSFLLTWYAQMPVPRLDPYSAHDTELLFMIHRLKAVAGYDLFLFNTTTETGIPSIWALAKNSKETGANLICAAGAHLDPVRAAKSAILELAAHAKFLDYMAETNREEYEQLLDDPYLVSEMPDHAFLYTIPEAEERLRFLLDPNRPHCKFADEFKPRIWNSDLTEDLKAMLQKFRLLDLEVIVVDQTTAETKRNGLFCVKVIIPGMLPMTFGHHLKRLTDLERVLRVPMELGFTQRLLSMDELNPHPHPFL